MSQWLVECDLIVTPGDLLPLQSHRRGQTLGVGVETLVEEAKHDEWAIATPSSSFGKALQNVHVLSVRVQGSVLKELAQFVEHHQDT